METLKIIITSVCILAFSASFAQDTVPIQNSINVINLEQNAISNIQYNTNVTDSTTTGVTPRGDTQGAIDSLESALLQTKAGSPQSLQVQLSLFVLEVGEKDKTTSKRTLNNLIKEFPANPVVQIYRTAYANVLRFNDYNEYLAKLEKSTWIKMPHYIKSMDVIERSFSLHVDTNINDINIDNKSKPVIVVLGFALHSDSSMDGVLVDRLKTALEAYNKYPNARIIVSGGGVQNGVTEAYMMKKWLVEHKVPADQITLEDLSISTVWNALNTSNIIKKLNPRAKDIILVTSDSHIKRAHSVFEQALYNNDISIQIYNLASKTKGYNLSEPTSDYEKALIIKDTLRTAGIWQMPGMVL